MTILPWDLGAVGRRTNSLDFTFCGRRRDVLFLPTCVRVGRPLKPWRRDTAFRCREDYYRSHRTVVDFGPRSFLVDESLFPIAQVPDPRASTPRIRSHMSCIWLFRGRYCIKSNYCAAVIPGGVLHLSYCSSGVLTCLVLVIAILGNYICRETITGVICPSHGHRPNPHPPGCPYAAVAIRKQ